jgi:hypothetical protein
MSDITKKSWLDRQVDLAARREYAKPALSEAAIDILCERRRQIECEGWTSEHDDSHDQCELAHAAACYANPIAIVIDGAGIEIGPPGADTLPIGWPEHWNSEWWKPKDQRRDLVKAASLIIAEIERIDRASEKGGKA